MSRLERSGGRGHQSGKEGLWLHCLSAFLVGFFLIVTFYCGLPFDFSDDLLRDWDMTREVSYREFFFYLLNPLTPAWFFYGMMPALKPIPYLLHKIFFDLWGLTLVPVHVLTGLACGLLISLLFFIAFLVTERKVYAWLIALLYLSFPTNAVLVMGAFAPELQFLVSFLTLLSMGALIFLTWKRKINLLPLIALTLLWFVGTWICIKWKSSEKILPFVYFVFLLTTAFVIRARVGLKRLTFLLGLNLAMFLLVVPIPFLNRQFFTPQPSVAVHSLQPQYDQQFAKKEKRAMSFKFSNIFARTLALPASENPLLTLRLDKSPISFTGNLGFFLGWFFWLGLGLSPFLGVRIKRRGVTSVPGVEAFPMRAHAMKLPFLWFLAVILGFGSGQSLTDVRYLNFALVPAMVLLAFLIRLTTDAFSGIPFLRKGGVLLVCAFLFTISQNFEFLTKGVGHFGGIQHALYESERFIFERFYERIPTDLELYQKHAELEKRAVVVSWYDLAPDWFEEAIQKFEKEKILFYKTRTDEDERLAQFRQAGYRVERLASFSFYDAKPLFFGFNRLIMKLGLKQFKPRHILVYQIT